MHRTVAAALVAALALALASCGGSETRTVSRAELVHRLETACLAGQSVIHEHLRGRRDAIRYLNAIIAGQKYVLKQIGDLETTGRAKAVFDGLKDTMRRRLPELERVASASRADFQRTAAEEEPLISPSGRRVHAALVALDAKHVCI